MCNINLYCLLLVHLLYLEILYSWYFFLFQFPPYSYLNTTRKLKQPVRKDYFTMNLNSSTHPFIRFITHEIHLPCRSCFQDFDWKFRIRPFPYNFQKMSTHKRTPNCLEISSIRDPYKCSVLTLYFVMSPVQIYVMAWSKSLT